jgi:hypothetical protein
MLDTVKRCTMCGAIISDMDDPTTDYYSHIRLKYCPDCRRAVEKRQSLERVKRYRERKRQQDRETAEQLRLLKEENELLRLRVAQLRQA